MMGDCIRPRQVVLVKQRADQLAGNIHRFINNPDEAVFASSQVVRSLFALVVVVAYLDEARRLLVELKLREKEEE